MSFCALSPHTESWRRHWLWQACSLKFTGSWMDFRQGVSRKKTTVRCKQRIGYHCELNIINTVIVKLFGMWRWWRYWRDSNVVVTDLLTGVLTNLTLADGQPCTCSCILRAFQYLSNLDYLSVWVCFWFSACWRINVNVYLRARSSDSIALSSRVFPMLRRHLLMPRSQNCHDVCGATLWFWRDFSPAVGTTR